MNLESIAFIPLISPLLAAAVLLFAKSISPRHKVLKKTLYYSATLLGFFISAIFSYLLLIKIGGGKSISLLIGGHYREITISYTFSSQGLIIFLLSLFISCSAWLYNERKEEKNIEFTIILLIQLFSIGATLFTRDLFNLFVALEIMGITSYVLIAFSSKVRSSIASLYYLLASSAAMAFFLLGTYVLYRLTGSLNYQIIQERLTSIELSFSLVFAVSSIIIAILMRSAIIPLYFWLPNAHAMAMHPVSAILSGVLIKIPLLALTPFVQLFEFSQSIGAVVKVLGAGGALIAVIFAFSQSDIKKLLAYHSVSQLGYIAAAWGYAIELSVHSVEGQLLYTAAFLHIIFHALFKSTLFLSCGTIIDVTGNRNVYTLRNVSKRLLSSNALHIVTIVSFFLAAFSISAIPFFNGYYSKNLITSSFHHQWTYPFLLLTSSFTIASFIKLSAIFFPSKRVQQKMKSAPYKVPILSLSLLSIALIFTSIWNPSFTDHLLSYLYSTHFTISFNFYDQGMWFKTLLTIVGGILLYLSLRLKTVKRGLHRIEQCEVHLEMMIISIILSIILLGIYLLV